MQVNRQKEIELINKAVQISKETNTNTTSVLKTLRYITLNEWHNKVLTQFLDENNTKSVAELSEEVNQSRQNVHIFLKKNISESELERLKAIKSKRRKENRLYDNRQLLHVENRIPISVISDNVIIDDSNNKYYRVRVHNRNGSKLFFCKENKTFIKKHRKQSNTREVAGFILAKGMLKYRSVLLDSSKMQEYFDSKELIYNVVK